MYMILEKFQWGMIHGGKYVRIVRVQSKEQRDGTRRHYVIISGDFPVHSTPPHSLYTIITYMLLKQEEGELPIFADQAKEVPEPTPLTELGKTRSETVSKNAGRIPNAKDVSNVSTFQMNSTHPRSNRLC